MRPRRNSDDAPKHGDGTTIDGNAIVAYNLRVIRERRGWTQEGVGERLAPLIGHQLSQAAISALERGFDGRRTRRFDAHDLYLFSVVFGVPIAYFFIPPPEQATAERVLAHTGDPLWSLIVAFLGRAEDLPSLDERLCQVDVEELGRTGEVLDALFDTASGTSSWVEHYHEWRKRRLDELAGEWDEGLQHAASVLTDFARAMRALRVEAFLEHEDGSDGSGENHAVVGVDDRGTG